MACKDTHKNRKNKLSRQISSQNLYYTDILAIFAPSSPQIGNITMTTILEHLFNLQDKEYAAFQAKLTPGVPTDSFIGVRIPQLRALAKQLEKEAKTDKDRKNEIATFLQTLPHRYYDENQLHGLLLSQMKDYDACIEATERFLPFVDNWAVCDIMSPKIFAKHKAALMEKIKIWSASSHTYTCRFGLEMLMTHFLDQDFRPEYLQIVASARSEDYYVRMMVAWFFATALAKQWDATLPYLESKDLERWTHNKT